MLFALDEDARLEGGTIAAPRYVDGARHGVSCAIAGAVLAAGGAYWWMRRTGSRSTPAVAATPAGGSVGWAATF